MLKDARLKVEDLRLEGEAYLRSKGWNQTSSTPGCVWMFEKEIDGKMYRVDFDAALRTQIVLEQEREDVSPPSS